MDEEAYRKERQKRAARRLQKATGVKYTQALREVQKNWIDKKEEDSK